MASPFPSELAFFFSTLKVATCNGLSTFEVQGQVEVPSVLELAAPPTFQRVG